MLGHCVSLRLEWEGGSQRAAWLKVGPCYGSCTLYIQCYGQFLRYEQLVILQQQYLAYFHVNDVLN